MPFRQSVRVTGVPGSYTAELLFRKDGLPEGPILVGFRGRPGSAPNDGGGGIDALTHRDIGNAVEQVRLWNATLRPFLYPATLTLLVEGRPETVESLPVDFVLPD